MKKALCVVALIVAGSALGFAQSASITLQNEEETTFYYTVDPPDLADLTQGSPLAQTRVAEFFATRASEPPFAPLAPGAQTTLRDLSDGPHVLIGFFVQENQDTFPVRMITLQADSRMGDRFYAIYGSPAIVDATRGIGRLEQFARSGPSESSTTSPTAEASPSPGTTAPAAQPAAAAAPQAAPGPLVTFSTSYNPEVFTREAQDSFTVQPIADSRSWNLRGTRVAALDARIDAETLTLSLTSIDGFSPDVSYFMYAFASRSQGATPVFTLELRPRALPNRGACLLWMPQPGAQGGAAAATPSIFGSVVVAGATATLTVDLKNVSPSFTAAIASATSFDLTSCKYDASAGDYEEFYFTTVAMADIPVTR